VLCCAALRCGWKECKTYSVRKKTMRSEVSSRVYEADLSQPAELPISEQKQHTVTALLGLSRVLPCLYSYYARYQVSSYMRTSAALYFSI
jgi:hypothetical protein